MSIKITALQTDFILHRMGASGAIAEVLNATYGYSEERVNSVMSDLEDYIEKTHLLRVEEYSMLETRIIEDCFNGSTWLVALRYECEEKENMPRYYGVKGSIQKLQSKLKKLGMQIDEVPD